VDPVPDPLIVRKSGSAENRTRTYGFVARNLTTRPQRWPLYQPYNSTFKIRFNSLYCRVMHPVAGNIKVVKIKPSLTTTVQDIYYVPATVARHVSAIQWPSLGDSHNNKH
jgi:hypothetical protein